MKPIHELIAHPVKQWDEPSKLEEAARERTRRKFGKLNVEPVQRRRKPSGPVFGKRK